MFRQDVSRDFLNELAARIGVALVAAWAFAAVIITGVVVVPLALAQFGVLQ